MIQFKACRRCKGDVELIHDQYGSYMHCLQRGWTADQPQRRVPIPVGLEASEAA